MEVIDLREPFLNDRAQLRLAVPCPIYPKKNQIPMSKGGVVP